MSSLSFYKIIKDCLSLPPEHTDYIYKDKLKELLTISIIPFTVLICFIMIFISYFPLLSNETLHSKIVVISIYCYFFLTMIWAFFYNANDAFSIFSALLNTKQTNHTEMETISLDTPSTLPMHSAENSPSPVIGSSTKSD